MRLIPRIILKFEPPGGGFTSVKVSICVPGDKGGVCMSNCCEGRPAVCVVSGRVKFTWDPWSILYESENAAASLVVLNMTLAYMLAERPVNHGQYACE